MRHEIIRAADRLRQGVTSRLSEPDSPDATQALRSKYPKFSHRGPEDGGAIPTTRYSLTEYASLPRQNFIVVCELAHTQKKASNRDALPLSYAPV